MNDQIPLPDFDRPLRWAQLTLVEDDPGRFDPDFWLDYFRRVHAEGVCLSAGGCVAYYPTGVPLHYRSRHLGEGDPFGYLVEGCLRLGMMVVARTDPHAAHQAVYAAHPEWIAVDAQGRKRRHWSHPDYWVTCALGPYNFEFMAAVTREIAARYPVAAIFCNRWSGSGICYCEQCRAQFTSFSGGMELPQSAGDPAQRPYHRWREGRLFSLWQLLDREVQQARPGCRFIPNTGGGALAELEMVRVGQLAPTLAADRQARSGPVPVWTAGKSAKEFRAALGEKPVIGIFSVGVEERHRWKDSVQSAAELRVWVADGIAHGMRPWFTKFRGVVEDGRWLPVVEEIYDWHHRHERYLRRRQNLARVGLVFSQQTARLYGGETARERVEGPIHGWYQALVEARIPFEMVHEGLLEGAAERFGLLILPNAAALSARQCEQLRRFVAGGGGLVATGESSLCDEEGNRRSDFGLADLFGVSCAAEEERDLWAQPMKNAYLRLHHPHPVLEGLEEAPRIIHGVHRLAVRPTVAFDERPVTLIPSYPDLPMEEVYPRGERPDLSELHLRCTEGGRVAYFNWDVDRTFWEVLCPDHGLLMANAARWALDEAPVVEVEGQGVIDVAIWGQEEGLTVHLVNLTNPMGMKGPFRELIPSPAQRVRLRLPEGRKAQGVKLLVSGRVPQAVEMEGAVEVEVPEILDHEVIAVEMETRVRDGR